MKSKSLDIKSLTSELKNISKGSGDSVQRDMDNPKEETYPDRSKKKNENKPDQNSQNNNGKSTSQFLEIVQEINAKNQYKIDKFIYVDSDIHEVFTKLKMHTKLRLSYLASYLLEDFIIKHKDSIKEIFAQKQNKFLD